jgi:CRISPR/Cas system-associated protein Cas7 (RAMP superfamily)
MVILSLPPVKAAAFASRQAYFIAVFAFVFLFIVVIAMTFVELWIKYFYGNYLKQVRKVLDELKEE